MTSRTENNALTFDSTDDARLDFLFHVIEGSSLERTTELLRKSWAQSPLDTMKLITNVRDIRRGKGIRGQFLICLKWLYENHLDTLEANLKLFAEFGCWKDYLNLLLIALFGELTYDCYTSNDKKDGLVSKFDRVILRTIPKAKRHELNQTKTTIREVRRRLLTTIVEGDAAKRVVVSTDSIKQTEQEKPLEYKSIKKLFGEVKKGSRVSYKVKTGREKRRLMNQHRRQYFAGACRENADFKRLYDLVVDLFARQMVEDYANLKAGKSFSLAAKWLPNPDRLFDKYLLILEPIARRFFELEGTPVEKHHLEQQFRKVYTKLRQKMHLPEIVMSAGSWSEVQYFNVPSVAMLRYKAVFARNDFERFTQYVEAKPVKGGALTPGEIILELVNVTFVNESLYCELIANLSNEKQLEEKVLEGQWKSLVDDIKSKGDLLIRDSLAICDVSGSMMGSTQKVAPMYASIGLTLMLLQLSTGPWSKKVISFSEEPKLSTIALADSLKQQIKKMLELDFGYSTDLNKAFALILSHAKEMKIPNLEMPKVLFIFTDMEFDEALPDKTNFEAAQMQFKEAGYTMPLVVFWNLKGDKNSRSTPVQCRQEGVFLLAGYSAQTLNFFFTCTDLSQMTPLTMLAKIIDDPRYDCVTVANSETTAMVVDELEASNQELPPWQQRTVVCRPLVGYINERHIEAFFSQVGSVSKVHLNMDTKRETRKGSANIEFDNVESVAKALALRGTTLGGVPITVQPWKPKAVPGKRKVATDIYVDSLPLEMSKEKLTELFSPIGTVVFVDLYKFSEANISKGCVHFKKGKAAKKAYQQLNGQEVDGRTMKLTIGEMPDDFYDGSDEQESGEEEEEAEDEEEFVECMEEQ